MLKSEYPRPAYTADNLIFLVPDDVDDYQKILLIKRSNDPFKDHWALPGGYVNLGETSEEAARREALEETGLKLPGLPHLVGIFDDPNRDPRGWVVSAAYAWYLPEMLLQFVQAGDDAKDAQWFSVNDLPNLAFDHLQIINKHLKR